MSDGDEVDYARWHEVIMHRLERIDGKDGQINKIAADVLVIRETQMSMKIKMAVWGALGAGIITAIGTAVNLAILYFKFKGVN